MVPSLPEIVNASLWDLPAYLGGYKSCVVCYELGSANLRSKIVTITSDETVLLRNLYERYRSEGLALSPSWKRSGWERDILQLRRKGLITYKRNKIFLSKHAFIAEYTLIPRV